MRLSNFKNIAVFHTAFIGDVVLSLPFIQEIKNNNHSAKITFITTPAAKVITQVCDAIDESVVFDKRNAHKGLYGAKVFSNFLNEYGFDLYICLHKYFRSSLISSMIKNSYKIGFNDAVMPWIYDKKVKYHRNIHEIERILEFLKVFDIKPKLSLKDVVISIGDVDVDVVNKLLASTNNYIVVSPGSVWETKRWTESAFISLIKLFHNAGINVVLTGSESEKNLCDRISKASDVLNLAGKTNLAQTIEVISRAKLIITNDSAPTHLAGLVNTPTITIYGPTSPIFGFYPRSDNSSIIRNETLPCSPCRIHGGKRCPINTHECMTSIKPEIVFEKSMNILKELSQF
ncbi:MAG: glycosyltransferase family 9 protein [Candidatus Kapaibacterium sp.]